MKVTAARPKVNEEAIENYINTRLLVGTITNRPVKEGDVVDIDYVGYFYFRYARNEKYANTIYDRNECFYGGICRIAAVVD